MVAQGQSPSRCWATAVRCSIELMDGRNRMSEVDGTSFAPVETLKKNLSADLAGNLIQRSAG